ncbi:MAG TPA: hypothetical protein VGF13_00225 [Verrucomicrobiae bacterium]|jgi:hypothetical protein
MDFASLFGGGGGGGSGGGHSPSSASASSSAIQFGDKGGIFGALAIAGVVVLGLITLIIIAKKN